MDVVGSKVCFIVVEDVKMVKVVVMVVLVTASWSLAALAIFSATVSRKLGLEVVVWQPLPAKPFSCYGPTTTS